MHLTNVELFNFNYNKREKYQNDLVKNLFKNS